jgi:SAM-dependent methyltransferase
MFFRESALAKKYCQGHGIEIGAAAHNPFNLSDCKFLAHNERQEFWRQSEISMCNEYIKPNYIGTAENIPVDDNTFDYVLSSHVIEHVPNPIAAFVEWNRVIKNNGIIFIIFPKRDADPKDVDRPINKLLDFVDQYKNPQPLTDEHCHIWIFDLKLMIELFEYMNDFMFFNFEIIESHETDDKVGNGHTIVVRIKK